LGAAPPPADGLAAADAEAGAAAAAVVVVGIDDIGVTAATDAGGVETVRGSHGLTVGAPAPAALPTPPVLALVARETSSFAPAA